MKVGRDCQQKRESKQGKKGQQTEIETGEGCERLLPAEVQKGIKGTTNRDEGCGREISDGIWWRGEEQLSSAFDTHRQERRRLACALCSPQ